MGVIADFLGQLFGGFMLGYLVSLLFGRLLFRENEPDAKATKAAGCAFFFIYLLSGWGNARGIAFDPTSGFFYIPGVFLAWLLLRRGYRKAWIPDEDTFI